MSTELAKASRGSVPAIIAAAGEKAVTAYRAFPDDPWLRPGTRKLYRTRARAFFRWAEQRGLALDTIDLTTLRTYRDEIAAARSSHEAYIYLTPVRGVFRSLVSSGVLSEDFFAGRMAASEPSEPQGDTRPRRFAGQATEASVGAFPLLSVMAMLAHMEVQSREAVLTDERIAWELLKFVRWRDGRACTHCGAPGEESETEFAQDRPFRCTACGAGYDLTDGSPFEGIPIPLQDGLFLLFKRYVDDQAQACTEAPSPGRVIDDAAASQLAVRIENALAREGLAHGEALRRAIDRRDREMEQDEITRGFVEYMEIQAHRDAFLKAKTEGGTAADLPPGMTLDEAIEKLNARMEEHDRYPITLKDGYLAYHFPDTSESAVPEREAPAPADGHGPFDAH
jgi:hypothetical protein